MPESPTPAPHLNRELLATCWTSAGDVTPIATDTRSPVGIQERLEAIAAAGFGSLGLYHSDLDEIRSGIGFAAFSDMLVEHGVRLREIELLVDWYLPRKSGSPLEAAEERLFAAATQLQVPVIKAAPDMAGRGVAPEVMAESFNRLATDAAAYGIRVAIEPMPWSNVATLADAADLVASAANPHGGIAVDSWHVAKGGTALSDIASILPLERVFLVELADGPALSELPLGAQAVHQRRPPGEGDLDTAGFVVAMHDLGYRGHWGVEIMSDKHRSLSVSDALTWTFDSTQHCLDEAQARLRSSA